LARVGGVRVVALCCPCSQAVENHMPKFSGDPSTATRRAAEARIAPADEKAATLAPVIAELQAAGVTSLRGIARAFNVRGIPPPRGHWWQATQVRRLLARMPA
jgi:Recombinase